MRIAAESPSEFQFRTTDTPDARRQKLELLRKSFFYDQSSVFSDGSIGQALSRFVYAHAAPYFIRGDGSDETAKWESLLGSIVPGDVVVFPRAGFSKITRTLLLGNGSNTSRSTLNSVTIVCPGAAHEVAFITPSSAIPKSGFYFEWHGAAGGTVMEIAGPINGIDLIGALQIDGRDVAGYGLRGFSFSNSIFFSLCVYNCTIANIDLDTRDATVIEGDANGLTSAHNTIHHVHSFSPNNPSAIALRIDGYEAAGGQDVTGCIFGAVRVGWNGNRGKGLWLGYTDFIKIEQFISIVFGALVGEADADPSLRPAPIFIDGSSLPFNAPTTAEIDWYASTSGTIQGGTNGQVYIKNYSLDDGGVVPIGIPGLNISRIHSADPNLNGLSIGWYQRPVIGMIGDGDGWYGKSAVGNHIASLTRRTNALHLTAFSDIEFEAGNAGAGPSGGFQFAVTPAGPSSTTLAASSSYASDAAAAAGGVSVGGFYRNGSAVQVRVV
jgi:hypothetical protein